MMYSMCCTYQQDIARYFCTAMEALRIPIYAHVAEDASLPHMHIDSETMNPVFRGKGRHTLACVLFASHYSEALFLHVNRILYDIAKAPMYLDHCADHQLWKSENIVSFLKPTIKETKQHTTVTWGASVATKWTH